MQRRRAFALLLGTMVVAFALVASLTVVLSDSSTAVGYGPYEACPTVPPGPTQPPGELTWTPSPTGTPCKGSTYTPMPTYTPIPTHTRTLTPTPCPPEGCPTPTSTSTPTYTPVRPPTRTPTPVPPTTTPDFSIGVDADGDTTDDCATKDGEPAKCSLPVGGSFTVRVYLDRLPEGIADYAGYDARLAYSGVTSEYNAEYDDWPDCVLGADAYGADYVLFGCAIGIDAPSSTYLGQIGHAGFSCGEEPSSGTVTLVHGAGTDTDLVSLVGGQAVAYAEAGVETLVINCVAAPPTPVGGSGFFAEVVDSSGGSAGIVIALVAASTAGAVALGGAAWYARRRWVR